MKISKLQHTSSHNSIINIKYCDTFISRLRGLMCTKDLQPNWGIILVDSRESRINATIHTLFMNFDITVLWLDQEMQIVDKTLAKKWNLFFIPKKPAQYVLELHSTKLNEYQVGEKLILIDKNSA